MATVDDATSLRVAICQAPSKKGDVKQNLETLEAYVSKYSSKADLAVFPECFLAGYGYKADDKNDVLYETAQGPSFQVISNIAKKYNIAVVYGFAEVENNLQKPAEERHFIAMNWVNADGSLVHTYRKSHLWTPSEFESDNFKPNDSKLSDIIEICGVKVGCLICFDVEVTEPARCLALEGAQLLLVIGANQDPFTLHSTVRVRAFENMCHLIYCNQTEHPLIGCSVAVDPTGTFLPTTPLLEGQPDDTIVVIQPYSDAWKRAAERNPLFAVRQPHLYKNLVSEEINCGQKRASQTDSSSSHKTSKH